MMRPVGWLAMNRSGPYGLLLVALLAYIVAGLPFVAGGALAGFLPVYVVDVATALGSGLSAIAATVGTACIVIGLAWWYQQTRSEADFKRYEVDLTRLANEFGKKIWIKPALGIGFSSGTGGVRVDIRINPARGFVLVYADCNPKAHFFAMGPRPDGKPPRGWARLGGGDHWEMFCTERGRGRQLYSDFAFRDVMEELFGSLQVQIVRHDDDGIEVVANIVDPGRAEGVIRRALKGVYWLAENNTAVPPT
jgi:hypothetical protein